MDATTIFFSAKFQTVTLLSCTPGLPSRSRRETRRELLRCNRFLRPPGGACLRRDSRRIFRLSSPEFVARASLDSQYVLIVVAVTALSALSIARCNQNYRKDDKLMKEALGAPGPVLPQVDRDEVVDHAVESKVSDIKSFQKVPFAEERRHILEKMREGTDALVDQEMPQFQETTLMKDDAFLAESLKSSAANSPLSNNVRCYSLTGGFEATSQTLPFPALPELDGAPPFLVVTETPKLHSRKDKIKSSSDHNHPMPMEEAKSSASVVFLDDSCAADNLRSSLNQTLIGEAAKTGCFTIFKDSVREDLYTFFNANESLEKHPPESGQSGLKPAYHHTFSDRGSFMLIKKNIQLHGAEPSELDPLRSAENLCSNKLERKRPHAYYKGASSHKSTGLGRCKGFPEQAERRPHVQETDLPLDNYTNRIYVKDERHDSQEQLKLYNGLLRDGRLTDCLDLLEDMERKGSLDMNNVYHGRFFNTCKSQKAVKEAFQFTKLIPNPTLSTFNMLISVCASCQDSEGAFQVMQLVQEAGLKADCKLYTTLISACAKSGKVDTMFQVFHEMVNYGVEPNAQTYGALIDGCARAGQVAKAFGAYGIMRSKNVKPDIVVFNALISACGQSGAVDRAFDVLAEMSAEAQPIDPDHITIAALMKACSNAGQVDRAQEVYKMMHKYNIKGTSGVYTVAVNCVSQTGDWEFVCSVCDDMKRKGVIPDEVFISALIDVAGHAGKLDAAFEIIEEATKQGMHLGIISYSSLMGACSHAKNWQKALELYEKIKSMKLALTVSTINALIKALCEGDQLPLAMEVLSEMKEIGLCPDSITYSMLLVASEKKDDLEAALKLLSQAKTDGVAPNLFMCRCIIGICLRRFKKACAVGEPVLSSNSARPQIQNEWTLLALSVYRETVIAGITPTLEVLSQVVGCLQLPSDASLKRRLIEDLGVSADASSCSSLSSLIDGFGEYDPRAFSLLEEAASYGIVPCVSLKISPITVDGTKWDIHIAEVYLLTVLKGLKHRLAAGAKLPSISILLPVEKSKILSAAGERTINLAARVGQEIAALLRRIQLPYQGNESCGKIRISGLALKRWFKPKLASPFTSKPGEWSSSRVRLGKGITHQQQNIRTANLYLEGHA